MKKTLIPVLLGLALPYAAHADTVFGVYVGGGSQKFEFTGDFEDSDLSSDVGSIDLEDDLGLDDESGQYIYIAIEHPVPFLPNVMLASTQADQDASSIITRDIEFEGGSFTAGQAVDSTIDISHIDATLYYELLDNWVNLDLGITVRQFDGEISLQSATDSAQEDLDFVAPLLYGKAQIDLPLTGLYVAAAGNWIGSGGNAFLDSIAKIGYESTIGLGVEAGYRNIVIQVDEDDLEADLAFSGVYAAATFHF
ncbi:hypothetical protein A9Q99_09335 [Gammaproteobacteria bacterium 45_16_T64]|nr:hypothetical protein A9Q99_09335 [Gammaproteobacteria bacterium 45_16_T64]